MWGQKEKNKARIKIRDSAVIKRIYKMKFIYGFSFRWFVIDNQYDPTNKRAKSFLKRYIK